jgi:hypothetical protein
VKSWNPVPHDVSHATGAPRRHLHIIITHQLTTATRRPPPPLTFPYLLLVACLIASAAATSNLVLAACLLVKKKGSSERARAVCVCVCVLDRHAVRLVARTSRTTVDDGLPAIRPVRRGPPVAAAAAAPAPASAASDDGRRLSRAGDNDDGTFPRDESSDKHRLATFVIRTITAAATIDGSISLFQSIRGRLATYAAPSDGGGASRARGCRAPMAHGGRTISLYVGGRYERRLFF